MTSLSLFTFTGNVLADHLVKPYSLKTKEGIVRALTVQPARGLVGQQLIKLFKEELDNNLRWVIGNALSVVATEGDLEQVLGLLVNSSYGETRSMLVHAIARLQGDQAIPTLMKYLKDKDIFAQAIIALGDLKASTAKEAIKSFSSHSDDWVREQVEKALQKIG
jgi:HEAT repeat protein